MYKTLQYAKPLPRKEGAGFVMFKNTTKTTHSLRRVMYGGLIFSEQKVS